MAKSIMQATVEKPSLLQRAVGGIAGLLWNTAPAVDPITALMQQRQREVQRGEFDPIGIIRQIQTDAGWIIFPSNRGPSLGRFHSDSQIDLLDAWEWNGLPDTFELTDQLCQECQETCNECGDSSGGVGKLMICGEAKTFAPGTRPCMYGNQIECCGGYGVIVSQNNAVCPTCGGSGAVYCRKCLGTGHMSTGKDEFGKMCASCGGSGRTRITHEQKLSDHLTPESFGQFNVTLFPHIAEQLKTSTAVMTEMRETVYLGPVYSLMLTGPEKCTEVWTGRVDDEGNFPHLVSQKHFSLGSRVLILGGVLRLQHKTSAPRRGRESRL